MVKLLMIEVVIQYHEVRMELLLLLVRGDMMGIKELSEFINIMEILGLN